MDTETTAHGSPEANHAHAHAGSSVNQIRIDFGAVTLGVVVALVIVIGGCGLVMGLNLSKQAQQDADFKAMKTQEWLLERRLMDREALDIVNGIKKPGDDQNGPTGNLQRMKPH
jgi:hypothetical protein